MTDEFHDEASYGALLADEYDAIYGDVFDTEGAVDQLARLAAGAGSSNSALAPVASRSRWPRRGLDVWGVDGSAEMLKILKEKPGGDKVTTLCGDFATTTAEGKFDLVVLLINTIYAMGSQQGQIECFENAARHLTPGGRFVIEAWVPDPPRGDALGLKARRLGRGFAGLVIEDHDAARQLLSTTQIVIDGTGRTRTFPLVHRYAWPSELDLMARLSGMTPREPLGRLARSPVRRTQHRPRIGVAVVGDPGAAHDP